MSYSINDLPVELLIGIMRRLDQHSLKAAILTCQRWKDVIETHCSWLIKLLDESISSPVRNMLLETNRIFHIELCIRNYVEGYLIDDFKPIGCKVTVLSWNNHSLNDLLFIELVKCMPNLEYIQVCYVTLPEVPDDCELPDLKKLTFLETRSCNDNTFKYFQTSNLKSFVIDRSGGPSTSSLHNVINFVRRQANLTTLILVNCGDMFFRQLCQKTPNENVSFKLTKLVLDADTLTNDCIGFVKFVKFNSETLRHFFLNRKCPNAIYELIFGELKKLKSLSLCGMSRETEFYKNLKINTSVENLLYVCNEFSSPAIQLLCKCVPNIKNLIFRGHADQLEIISTELRKVTTLCVFELQESFNQIKFPNLTSCYIQQMVDCRFDWDTFTKANSAINEIVLKSVYNDSFTSDHVETLTRNLKLQSLKIGSGFSADERFLSIIHKNLSDLKVLELHESCGIQDVRRSDGCVVSLRLVNKIELLENFPWI